jgi:hypothetical protein
LKRRTTIKSGYFIVANKSRLYKETQLTHRDSVCVKCDERSTRGVWIGRPTSNHFAQEIGERSDLTRGRRGGVVVSNEIPLFGGAFNGTPLPSESEGAL